MPPLDVGISRTMRTRSWLFRWLAKCLPGVLFALIVTPQPNVGMIFAGKRESIAAARGEAIHRLLQVFGMEHPGRRERHLAPPQYMLDLYNAIADSTGITKTPNPYHANIVRSFPDQDLSRHLHFFFNVTSNVPQEEKLLEAEFHLYKLKPRGRLAEKQRDPRSHLLEVRVYQIMSHVSGRSEEGNRLLDVRRMSAHSVGWEVFYVKQAVLDWLKDEKKNLGLLVTVRSLLGEKVEDGLLRFAKRHQHHINKQPVLVLFTDDGRPRQKPYFPAVDFHDYGFSELSYLGLSPSDPRSFGLKQTSKEWAKTAKPTASMPASNTNSSSSVESKPRGRRATTGTSSTSPMLPSLPSTSSAREVSATSCTRHELYVDFDAIGWSEWIISPKGYNAYYCKGECAFPLGQNQWPTNHATVQSIVHELSLSPGVGTPCCVPNKLYSISLLYFDEHGNVILKQYDDMVAASCGCH